MKKGKRFFALLLTLMLLTGNFQETGILAEESVSEMQSEYHQETEKASDTENVTETEAVTEKPETESEILTEMRPETETETKETEQVVTETEAQESERISEDGTESEGLSSEDTEQDTETETETQSETESESGEMDDGIALFDMTQRPSGTAISQTSGWKAVSAGNRFSSQYRPVKFYPGVSKLELFNSSSQVTVGTTSSGRKYLYPKTAGQGGKFGAIYRKVLYYNHKWYDLKMTVAGYTTEINCDGGGKTESYPFILMYADSIEWRFHQALGGLVLKCEFLENGTGSKAAVNTRFQWWDVDGGQRFGMKTENGSVAGRYYYSGSPVYVQRGQSIAGIGNLEMVVGQGDDTPTNDPRYCVTYELAGCSTYYMAIGPRDHIDQDDYSYSKTRLKEMNEKLANGQASNADGNEALMQTDSSLSIIDTIAPEKKVSADGKNWVQQTTLKNPSDSYWYQIGQFVPWQDKNAYYQSLVIQDNLPPGVVYAGSLKIVREEDGADVTGSFSAEQKGQLLKISAKSAALSGSSFYGYHYLMRFQVKWNLSVIKPQYTQNTASYSVRNTAALSYRHISENKDTTKNSNEVLTQASVLRKEQDAPVKYLNGDMQKKEETLPSIENAIRYTVQQKLPVNEAAFVPSVISMTDQLEDCLELQKVTVEIQKQGKTEYEVIGTAQIQNQGNTLTVKVPFIEDYNGGTIRFQMHCKIKKNADLSAWKKKEADGSIWITVPNEASVTLEWSSGTPGSISKKTNSVLVKIRINHIRITKEIQAEDIVWAHGNPTFTFGVEGTDTNGNPHKYYQTVIFYKQDTPQSGKTSLTAEFEVPAGRYEAFEEKTMRYRLKEIRQVINGTVQSGRAQFDLRDGGDGQAVFCNEKVTDQDESHTDFVRNAIKVK